MLHYLKLYLATLAVFLTIDLAWLGFIARPFYQKHLGYILASPPNWIAAILFYLIFVAGILVFVVVPGLNTESFTTTLLRAGFFGLVTYATYDLTNLATVKDWPAIVTFVDMIWGTVLSIAVSCAGLAIGKII